MNGASGPQRRAGIREQALEAANKKSRHLTGRLAAATFTSPLTARDSPRGN
jgi:hypothetical protein